MKKKTDEKMHTEWSSGIFADRLLQHWRPQFVANWLKHDIKWRIV